jgi:hypothetical protein
MAEIEITNASKLYYLGEIAYKDISKIYPALGRDYVQRVVSTVKKIHGPDLKDDTDHMPLSRAIWTAMHAARPRSGQLWYTMVELKEAMLAFHFKELTKEAVEERYGITRTTLMRHMSRLREVLQAPDADRNAVMDAVNMLQFPKCGVRPYLYGDEVSNYMHIIAENHSLTAKQCTLWP